MSLHNLHPSLKNYRSPPNFLLQPLDYLTISDHGFLLLDPRILVCAGIPQNAHLLIFQDELIKCTVTSGLKMLRVKERLGDHPGARRVRCSRRGEDLDQHSMALWVLWEKSCYFPGKTAKV